jgi:hypothetical protein
MNGRLEKKIWIGIIVGTCVLHDENDNGTRLINHAVHQRMITQGTLLPHKHIHKGKWHGPVD